MLLHAFLFLMHLFLRCASATAAGIQVGCHDMHHDAHLVVALSNAHHWVPLKCSEEGRPCPVPFLRSQINALVGALGNYNLDHVRHVVYSASNSDLKDLVYLLPHFMNLTDGGMMLVMDHHRLHAVYGFLASPFASALVLAVDGGGGDGESFVTYHGTAAGQVVPLRRCSTCRIGIWYDALRGVLGDARFNELPLLARAHAADPEYLELCLQRIRRIHKYDWVSPVRFVKGFLEAHPPNTTAKLSALQAAPEAVLVAEAQEALRRDSMSGVAGIVFVGGVAHNPGLCAALTRLRLPVWVAAAPGDATLAFGAVWAFSPPPARPAVHFAYRRPMPALPQGAACQPRNASRLGPLLTRDAKVGVVAPGAALQDHYGNSNIPGHQTIVSCGPQWPGHADVIMEHGRVPHYFHTPVTVTSPAHAFLLEARHPQRMPAAARWLRVAAVERGQDSTMDWLLHGAQACPVPMLFAAPLPATLAGVHHVMWDDKYCRLPVD